MGKKSRRSARRPSAPAAPKARLTRRQITLVSVGVIVIAGLVVFRRVLFGGEILAGVDVIAGAAIFEDYAREQMSAGHLPLWNPYMFSGMPFFENTTWNAAVYPSYWLKIALETLPGVQLPRLFFLVLHYLLAGLGMFFFLRSRRVGNAGAVTGSLAFMLSPHLIGLATIGHGGKVLTMAYLPLLLMAAYRLLETGERRWVAILALVGGLQFLARHVQVSYYAWLAVIVLLVFFVATRRRDGEPWPRLSSRAGGLLAAAVLAAAVAAVLLLPLREYTPFSTRAMAAGGIGFENATMWSFHPKEILTFFVPSLFGLANETYWGTMPFQQVTHYMGYVVLCLAAIAVVRKRDRDVRFLTILFLLGLFMSFGRHIGPVYRVIYSGLPGFSRFRVPALALLVSQFSAAALAGHGASVLLGEIGERKEHWTRWAIGTVAVGGAIGAAVLLARSGIAQAATNALLERNPTAAPAQMRELALTAARLAVRDGGILLLFAVATGVSVFVIGTRKLPRIVCAALLLGLVLWDIGIPNARFMEPERMRPLSSYYPVTPAVSYLKDRPGVFRVAPMDQTFSSNAWMYHRIQSIGGYHPAKLRIYNDLLTKVGVGNLKLLAMLNAAYVVTPQEIQHEAFESVAPGLYRNAAALPRIFLIGEAKEFSEPGIMLTEYTIDSFDPSRYANVLGELPGPVESVEGSRARIVSYRPERIEVEAEIARPCLLVFSEVYYPLGWKALVDGEETPIYRTNYAFRSVYLEPGRHSVVMRYESPSLRIGLLITICASILIAVLWALPFGSSGKARRA